jgi:hypothetical protein
MQVTFGGTAVSYTPAGTIDAIGENTMTYNAAARTNWHYECANAFLDGTLRTS